MRSVALVCLTTMLAFAGLEALHQHPLARPSTELQPCRICQIAASTLASASPVRLLRPHVVAWNEVSAPSGSRPSDSEPVTNVIRPPPEPSALP